MKNIYFKCIVCNKEYELQNNFYVCPKCSGNLDIQYDYKAIKNTFTKEQLADSRDYTIWRYMPLYPVQTIFRQPILGWNPLYKAVKLEKRLEIKNIYLKDETRNPSASFKDRASAIFLAKALDEKYTHVVGASTGNAASSTACLAAGLGIKTTIYVPKSAPKGKLAQLYAFGADVFEVDGTYDKAFDLSIEVTKKHGLFNRNTGFNPYTREGKKSCAFEICEQLNFKVPDYVFIPTGDGNILSGIWKGFTDFYKIGFIDNLPKLVACQARYSNAIKKAFEKKTKIDKVSGKTVADSISVSYPKDGDAAVKAIKESKGFCVSLSDKEILESINKLAKNTGVYAEPAAAASLAGLIKSISQNKITKNDTVVLVVTGSGLKDPKIV